MALDERGDAGLAAPMDRLDLGYGVFPPLDDAVLNRASLADVVDTASFWPGVSDSFQPLVGLNTILREFTEQANLGLAPALASIELLVPQVPNIGEMVGQSLLEGLGTRNAALSALAGVQPQVLSLSETVNSVLQSSAVNTLGLDGLNSVRAVLSVVEPQINSLASVVGSAARLSSMAEAFQPLVGLGELVRQSHVGLAPVFEGLPALIAPLSSVAKVAGTLASNSFAIQVGLPQLVQDVLRALPPMADLIGGHVADLFAGVRSA
ncbi:hypothetical protein [Streptomyces gossypiisoli]|uniref:hypothetical protein n=1 Tax=Streptomyces gossypiisoli TaxID=2748864 RepID=UPI001E431F88|nr:hypothetical protein [Streptomyces gossypiisoli]